MTRLLFVTKTIVYGGTEKHLVDLVRRLDAPDLDCTILCYGSDVFSPYLPSRPGVRVVTLGPVPEVRFLSCWLAFAKRKPRVIVFVNCWLGLFPWYAYVAARLSGARRLFAIEQLMAPPPPPRLEGSGLWNRVRRRIGWQAREMWKQRLSGALADQTICVSNAVRERLVGGYGYPESKTMTVFNGVDLSHFKADAEREGPATQATASPGPHVVTLLCVGNLWKQKRVDILLDALALVVPRQPSCRCVIVGSGPLEDGLKAQAARLGLDQVRFAGRAEDVRPFLEAADIFCLSSENEGLPLVLGEAMAYGVPCIVTDVGGNREIVTHGQTGLVVEPDSPEEFARAIEHLLLHPEERRRMGANSLRRVRELFNIDHTMESLRRVLVG